MDFEAQLREYRNRRKEALENSNKEKERLKLQTAVVTTKETKRLIDYFIPRFILNMSKAKEKCEEEVLLMENEENEEHIPEPPPTLIMEDTSDIEVDPASLRYSILKWSIIGIIWLSLYMYFLYIQFGAVFFVISMLAGIYYNTRTRPKRKDEVSAYSVFNKNCASIHGTVDAEKLQKEMFFGAASFRI